MRGVSAWCFGTLVHLRLVLRGQPTSIPAYGNTNVRCNQVTSSVSQATNALSLVVPGPCYGSFVDVLVGMILQPGAIGIVLKAMTCMIAHAACL